MAPCFSHLCAATTGYLAGVALGTAQDPVYPSIKTVHVVPSCHLDLGFADSSLGIVNEYFDHHLPYAAQVGEELRQGVTGFTDNKLNFMFQSWILNLFFDCPLGLGLHCPSPEQVKHIEAAIAVDDITWHAFPHNAQLEVMDPAMIKAGIELTHALDRRFGQSPKRTLSQRDVPGMTRAVIPTLRAKNVTAISIGANGGSTPADVPPCFLWHDPGSNQSILALYTWPGYGSLPLVQERLCFVDGLDHALVYNWNGDNAGPLSSSDYGKTWALIQQAFPNANIYASTFDNFTQHLEQFRDKLPVVEKEVGDTWIYGVPSDPQKVARMQVLNRVYAELDTRPGGIEAALARDLVLRNATRFVLKNPEHTWGSDTKKFITADHRWKNSDFEQARSTNPNFLQLERSWWEQRSWGFDVAVETLAAAGHPLTHVLLEEFAALDAGVPQTAGFRPGKVGERFQCGATTLAFDETAALSALDHRGFVWADATHALLQLKYRSYSVAEVDSFIKAYVKSNESWAFKDYGKEGLPEDVQGKVWQPTLTGLYVKQDHERCSFAVNFSFGLEAVRDYGASAGWLELAVVDGELSGRVNFLNKTATRLPEAMFLQTVPTISAGDWYAKKLGSWVGATDGIGGGARHLHGGASAAAFRVTAAGRTLEASSQDAAVVNFGELQAYPIPTQDMPDTAKDGGSFVLWDNLWGTNYVMWWPFSVPEPFSKSASFPKASNADLAVRFKLSLDGPLDGASDEEVVLI